MICVMKIYKRQNKRVFFKENIEPILVFIHHLIVYFRVFFLCFKMNKVKDFYFTLDSND